MFFIVAALIAAFPAEAPTSVRAQNPCDNLVVPRLTRAGAARVTTTYGLSLKNRAAPGSAGATEVALMTYGTTASVIDGPVCNYGYVWWKIELSDGTLGWAAEGGAAGTDYYMEPYAIGLHAYQANADKTSLTHYLVGADGSSQMVNVFSILPATGTPQTVWQPVETTYLGQAIDSVRQNCPDKLTDTTIGNAGTLEAAVLLPLPTLEYEYYPSPEGNRLLLVRHQHLLMPRCDNVLPERVGISTVSVLDANGVETVLFPFPQHGSVPQSADVYRGGDPTEWNVYLDEVLWSPHGQYIAFVASYRYPCNRKDCFRSHLYVSNLETGQLYILGEARHVGWASGGERINFFRQTTGADGKTLAYLYTAKPDGTDRQEVWLPGGAVYISDTRAPLGFPWNDGGTQIMVGNAGVKEVMLFTLVNRSFSPPVRVPDNMPLENRLSVHIMQGDQTFFWSTIRGEFAVQNTRTGNWTDLNSTLATTGVAPIRVRPFPLVDKALVEMSNGTAYILDITADLLIPVTFGP
jgi:hypothetical protein